MRLHGNVGIEVVKSTVCLFAAIPSALVHPLNLLVASAGSLMLLCAGNRNKRIHLASAVSGVIPV